MSHIPSVVPQNLNKKLIMGDPTKGSGAGIVRNTATTTTSSIKLNSKAINNELRLASTTTAAVIPKTAAPPATHTIQPVSTVGGAGGSQFIPIQLIPLQIANVSSSVTVSTALPKGRNIIVNEMPTTTIVAKSNQRSGEFGSGGGTEIMTHALPFVKHNIRAPIVIGTGTGNKNTQLGSSSLASTTQSPNLVTGPAGGNAAINGPTKIIFQKPTSQLQRFPVKAATATTVMATKGHLTIADAYAINGSNKKEVNTTTTGSTTKLSPIQSSDAYWLAKNKIPGSLNVEKEQQQPLPKLTASAPPLSVVTDAIDNPTPISISKTMTTLTAANTSKQIVSNATTSKEASTPQVIAPTTSTIIEKTITATVSPASNDANFKATRADSLDNTTEPMLVIDDSTDNEDDDEDDVDDDFEISGNDFLNISNSVILTKASPAENRAVGPSAEPPANVVIMKLPSTTAVASTENAAVNVVQSTSSDSVAIPFTDALSMATAKTTENSGMVTTTTTSSIKVIPTSKLLAPLTSRQPPAPALTRSNSIPEPPPPKSPTPRASKRSQSLTLQSTTPQKETESAMNNNNNSSDDSNKNMDLTCIELDDDDSFDEEYLNHSNSAAESKTNLSVDPQKSLTKNTGNSSMIPLMDKSSSEKQGISEVPIITVDLEAPDENKSQNIIINLPPPLSLPPPPLRKHVLPLATARKIENVAISNAAPPHDETQEQMIKSLLCHEQLTSSSSSASSMQDISPKFPANTRGDGGSSLGIKTGTLQSAKPTRLMALPPSSLRMLDRHDTKSNSLSSSLRDSKTASTLSMVSTFDMLNWKEDRRIATARGTAIRFELNEFNLLQLHERGCPPRRKLLTAYERPIYERIASTAQLDQADPLLYLCRKCKLYGPAVEFLAPEFCSLECLRRSSKRGHSIDNMDTSKIKRARKNAPTLSSTSSANKTLDKATGVTSKSLPVFRWQSYLSTVKNACAAPIDLFLNPFPTGPNPFVVGMKLEAIDPENCSLFCVCSVAQINGYRMLLHFDGYDSKYDFWVNADSMDIFPHGWTAKTNRILQPPRDYERFDWAAHFRTTNSVAADKKLFTHLNGASLSNRNPFTVGMHLEAEDLNDTGKLCVASVADVLNERIRVHFDGWDDCYDYWVDISSPYIHPCGWHEGRTQLLVPPEYSNTTFNWVEYINEAKQGVAAHPDYFVPRDAIDYRTGMKLEVVDPRNRSLIRPATVVHRIRHRVKVHLDCWPPEYTFWLEDDSPDLHPIGWCDATGHSLEPPPGFHQLPVVLPCSTNGCRGIGNMDRNSANIHTTAEACPYTLENWRVTPEKKPRIEGKQILRRLKHAELPGVTKTCKINQNENQHATSSSTAIVESSIKPLNKPFKYPGRGRPRKADRLAAEAAAAAAAEAQRQLLQSSQRLQRRRRSMEPNIRSDFDVPVPIKTEVIVPNGSMTPISSTASSPMSMEPALEPHIQVSKRFLCDYGPRLQQNYAIWRDNLAVDISDKVQRNPLLWTTAETCAFIDTMLSDCNANKSWCAISAKFYKHDIDGTALLMLQQEDLTEVLELKLGPAAKLTAIILQLRMLVVNKY